MSTGTAYYNENDPKKAAWLRELIKADIIAPGEVDERSITEIRTKRIAQLPAVPFFRRHRSLELCLTTRRMAR
jgi:DNA (cytosine-5)-methyltransferase 1